MTVTDVAGRALLVLQLAERLKRQNPKLYKTDVARQLSRDATIGLSFERIKDILEDEYDRAAWKALADGA
jgi:hypothetical protein